MVIIASVKSKWGWMRVVCKELVGVAGVEQCWFEVLFILKL